MPSSAGHARLADAEARDDFVEDQQRAGTRHRRAARCWSHAALRQQAVVRGQRLRRSRRRVAVRARRRHASSASSSSRGATTVSAAHCRGYSGARRRGLTGQPAAGFHEHAVGVTVIAALELQDARAAGRRARDCAAPTSPLPCRTRRSGSARPTAAAPVIHSASASEYGSHAPKDQPSSSAAWTTRAHVRIARGRGSAGRSSDRSRCTSRPSTSMSRRRLGRDAMKTGVPPTL